MSNEIQRHIFLFTKSETEKSAIQYTTYSQSHTHISTGLMQFLSQEAFIHLQLFFFTQNNYRWSRISFKTVCTKNQ